MRIATWNINSLRLRAPLLTALQTALRPDVICLQETKVPDELFPHAALESLGYAHIAFKGMKGYNGVAILSRFPLETIETPDWCAKGDTRHLHARLATPAGTLDLHNFYVPAGGDIPDREANPKYAHKLDFIEEARAWFVNHKPKHPTVLMGDLNIAPLEQDVWSHKQLLDVVSHTPPETEGLTAWLNTGFHDALRHFVPPEQKLYTWWSYRNKDWRASNRGRRLDHIWVTPSLVSSLRSHQVLVEARDWERGSDHVPVMVEIG
jgi:exodeoxyribonuclease-3